MHVPPVRRRVSAQASCCWRLRRRRSERRCRSPGRRHARGRGPADCCGMTIEASDPRLAAALLADAASVPQRAATHRSTSPQEVPAARHARRRAHRAASSARSHKEPRLAAAHEELARVWRDWGCLSRASASAYRAIYYDPASASAQNTLGTMLDALGTIDDARARIRAALDLDPTAGVGAEQPVLPRVPARAVRGRARRSCEAALRGDPALVAAHNNLALDVCRGGRLDRGARGVPRRRRRGSGRTTTSASCISPNGRYARAARRVRGGNRGAADRSRPPRARAARCAHASVNHPADPVIQ